MMQYFFLTESYPFSFDFSNLNKDPSDSFILITKDVFKSLSDSQKLFFDKILVLDDFSLEKIIEVLKNAIVDRKCAKLVSHDDFIYSNIAKINEMLNIDGYRLNNILPFINKRVMKDRLVGEHATYTKYLYFDNFLYMKDADSYLNMIVNTIGFPLIVKPIDGAGAIGVQLINSFYDLACWCEDHRQCINYEFNEYIDNASLFHCDSIIRDGEVLFTQVSKYSYPCAMFKCGKVIGSYTLSHSDEQYQKLRDFSSLVLNIFNKKSCVPDGVSHMEVFQRNNGELVFLEVQFRPPGANVKRAYLEYLGVNLEELHFKLQMKKGISLPSGCGPYAAWFYYPTKRGKVAKLIEPPVPLKNIVMKDFNIKENQITNQPDSILDAEGQGFVALSLVISSYSYEELKYLFNKLCSYSPYILA